MDQDHSPDTILMDQEADHWIATQADDVFDPAVRVVLGWHDVEAAVERGAVVPAQAHAMWAGWASQNSPQLVGTPPPTPPPASPAMPQPLVAPPVMAATPQGWSLGVVLGVALVAALLGALLSYMVLAR